VAFYEGFGRHSYMMRGSPTAFHPATRDFSMVRTLAILDGLSGGRAPRTRSIRSSETSGSSSPRHATC
jgi:hypothetical protein